MGARDFRGMGGSPVEFRVRRDVRSYPTEIYRSAAPFYSIEEERSAPLIGLSTCRRPVVPDYTGGPPVVRQA